MTHLLPLCLKVLYKAKQCVHLVCRVVPKSLTQRNRTCILGKGTALVQSGQKKLSIEPPLDFKTCHLLDALAYKLRRHA